MMRTLGSYRFLLILMIVLFVGAQVRSWFSAGSSRRHQDLHASSADLYSRVDPLVPDDWGAVEPDVHSYHRQHLSYLAGPLKFNPSIDLYENSERFVVRIDIPGTNPGNIKAQLDGQVLMLSEKGKNGSAEFNRGEQSIQKTVPQGLFSRTVALPVPVRADGMTLEVKSGFLEISIPKVSG